MITGLLTPPTARQFTYPSSLKDEIEAEVGKYSVFYDEPYSVGREERHLASLKRTEQRRFQTVKYLYEREPWDFFMVVFSATDVVQHYFWRYIDPNHPGYDEDKAQRYGDSILNIYRQMDEQLGYFLDQVDEHTTLIAMSDHGAGAVYKRTHLNNWLMQQDLLRLKNSALSKFKYHLFRRGFTFRNVHRLLRRMVNQRYRGIVPRRTPGGLLRHIFLSHRDVDWSRTKAFAFGGNGEIFINVRGRDAEGVVEPGQEYEEVREQIMAGLAKLTIPGTGQPLVARSYKKEELYHGEEMDAMPDILIEPADWNYSDCGDLEFSSNKLFDSPVVISGHHRKNGILALTGRGAKSGLKLDGTNILDLAPTILYLLGQPVPEDMDGRVLKEALTDDFLAEQPIEIRATTGRFAAGEVDWSEEEEEAVKERLRGLGYLG
jgi:predicted AlkP superfamily phosphohydrolase/phosphomutase